MPARVRAALVVLSLSLFAASCGDDGSPTSPLDPVSIRTESLTEAIEGRPYGGQLEATGGSGDYSWALTAGSLPAGLTLAPEGMISGTPIAPVTSSFRVRATDSEGQAATADLSITVVQKLAIHTAILADGVVDEDYSAELRAVGGRGSYSWSVTGGGAATWLAISANGGLAGRPTAAGASILTVRVEDESGQEATRELVVVVLQPLAVAPLEMPTATQGRDFAAQLVATGGDGTYAWTMESGALPTGVGLSGGGALTGVPADEGTFAFSARVTDGADRVATGSFSLTVEPAPTIRTTGLPPGDLGAPYAAELVATGGTGGYTWSVVDGVLPPGLTLSAAGTMSGVPTAMGSATFTVQVSDERAATHARAFTIVVAEIAELASGVPIASIAGDAGSVRYYGIDVPAARTELTISTSGGTGDVDLYVRYGDLPREFTYDCRPLREGNDETCTRTSPTEGRWYVMLRGHTAYAGVSLVATVQ